MHWLVITKLKLNGLKLNQKTVKEHCLEPSLNSIRTMFTTYLPGNEPDLDLIMDHLVNRIEKLLFKYKFIVNKRVFDDFRWRFYKVGHQISPKIIFDHILIIKLSRLKQLKSNIFKSFFDFFRKSRIHTIQ